MANRLYDLTHDRNRQPIVKQDIGTILNISGVLLQGGDDHILVVNHIGLPIENLKIVYATLEEFSDMIRQSDDPELLIEDESGMTKTIVRKNQFAISGAVQQRIFHRDGYQCMYCGAKSPDVPITIDHFMPLQLNGVNNTTNYLTACRKCNKHKADIHPVDWCEINNYDYAGLMLYLEGKASKAYIEHLPAW